MSTRLLTAAAAAAVLALAGCANSDLEDEGSSEGEASGGSETRTVQSPFTDTEVEIPAEPQRVVGLWRTGQLIADLGVEPVGILQDEFLETELDPETYAAVEDTPTVGTFEGVDPDEVIALEPDLIVGMDNGGLSIDYEELSEIAPTVVLEIAEPPDVWDNYPEVADLLGVASDFEEQNAALDEDLAAVAEEHGDEVGDLEAVAVGSFDGTIFVDTSKALTYERIDAAGFGYAAEYTDDPERYTTELSRENIPDLADYDLLFYEVGLDGEPAPDMQEIIDLPSFQRLPAVEAGNLFPLTSGVNYTFTAAQEQVEQLRTAAEDYTP